jgi:dolichol-phosphate mannosyltransferase
MRKIAIIPVFNEEGKISQVLSKFSNELVEQIVVVNDGSTDNSMGDVQKFQNLNIKILEHKKRKGVGAAIRTGIDYALENNFDIIVVLAGNGKDDPREIPKLVEPILKEDYDYVQGSRFLEGGSWDNLPLSRYIGIKLYSFLWSKITGFKITDVSNGFRAYKTSIFKDKRINIWQSWLDSYELEFYIHYKVLKLGYKFIEVPVSKIYPVSGKYTKIRPIIDWWKIVKPLIYLSLGIKK